MSDENCQDCPSTDNLVVLGHKIQRLKMCFRRNLDLDVTVRSLATAPTSASFKVYSSQSGTLLFELTSPTRITLAATTVTFEVRQTDLDTAAMALGTYWQELTVEPYNPARLWEGEFVYSQ